MALRAPMTLASLLGDRVPDASAELVPDGLCQDSRRVAPGDVFVALQGDSGHGLAHVAEAEAAGAVAVLVDAGAQREAGQVSIPMVAVPGLAQKLPAIAARFYAEPSRDLHVLGITGTNGKTSCAWLYANWAAQLQQHCGMLGTLGVGVISAGGSELEDSGFTTPDVISVQRQLAALRQRGCSRVAMEVSSHALEQGRVEGVQFDSAIFTNLSRDHLDYHGDMHSYARAKRRLFERESLSRAAVNVDDAEGRNIIDFLRGTAQSSMHVIGCSLQAAGADVHCADIHNIATGSEATVHTPQGSGRLYCPMPGAFSLANTLLVLAVLLDEGFALQELLDSAASLPAVPGRMQLVLPLDSSAKPPFMVYIDYAHTPDALEHALLALRPHTRGQLFVVFGAGGDRDRGKRSMMGAAASQYADRVFLTSDNPRNEAPEKIVADIREGMQHGAEALVELDRATAIETAIAQAEEGDVVLVAGKGHERFQQLGETKRPFCDYAVAQAAVQARCAA